MLFKKGKKKEYNPSGNTNCIRFIGYNLSLTGRHPFVFTGSKVIEKKSEKHQIVPFFSIYFKTSHFFRENLMFLSLIFRNLQTRHGTFHRPN